MLLAQIFQSVALIVTLYLSYKERARLVNLIIAKSPIEFRQLEAASTSKKSKQTDEPVQRPFGL